MKAINLKFEEVNKENVEHIIWKVRNDLDDYDEGSSEYLYLQELLLYCKYIINEGQVYGVETINLYFNRKYMNLCKVTQNLFTIDTFSFEEYKELISKNIDKEIDTFIFRD